MIKFRQFLDEETKPSKLTHVKHLEDLVLHHGHEGVEIAAQHLDDTHDFLLGKGSGSHISEKFDGAPSVVFGRNPENGKFFVGTKSAFNVTPKLNYTVEDIDKNHGHAPELAEKLKKSLEHLPKIMPHDGGVYQGDLMYTKGDIKRKDNKYHFTPNTITYSTPQDGAKGKAIKASQLGIVVHTKYKGGKDIAGMTAVPLDQKTRSKFSQTPEVNHIDPTIKVNPSKFSAGEQKEFMNHKELARMAYNKMKPEAMDAVEGHGQDLESYINKENKNGVFEPSVQGYIDHLHSKTAKEASKVVMQSSKAKKMQDNAENVQHIITNKNHFDKVIELHGHLQRAKDTLVDVLNKNSEYEHSINGEKTGAEGAVLIDPNGNTTKLVKRSGFSRQNANGVGNVAKAKEAAKKK